MLVEQESAGPAGEHPAGPVVSLVGLGDPGGVAELVRRHADHPSYAFAWVPTAALPQLDPARLGLRARRTGWEWLWTRTAPPRQPAEPAVVELDGPGEAGAVRDCLADANPGTDADPEGPGERWWGVRDAGEPGRLVGVIGAQPRRGTGDAAAWHLHGLGVRASERGRGLGAALTAAAVRGTLAAGASWTSLGMWDDNDAARRVYHRLGLRTRHRLITLTAVRPATD